MSEPQIVTSKNLDLNPGPLGWKSDILPTELCGLIVLPMSREKNVTLDVQLGIKVISIHSTRALTDDG